jgi:putative inorganic carbon (HCO3(-)) transporter
MAIVALGVIVENLIGPTWPGWLAIIGGILLILFSEKPRTTPLRWPILLLSLLAAASLLVTADSRLTTPQVTRLLAGISAFVALVNWARTRQQLLIASLLLIATGMLIAILAPVIVNWNLARGVPIPGVIYENFPLLFADAVHPNVMVSIMLMIIPLPVAYLLLSSRRGPWPLPARWAQWFLFMALFLMVAVLLLTQSRGGYAAAAIAVLMVFWFSRHRILAVGLTFVTVVIGFWLFLVVEQQAPTVVGELADASTLAFRQQVWRIASWMISDFPFTGVGMGTFNEVAMRLYPFPAVSDPGTHNLYLQTGVDLGLPGLIAFLAIVLLTLTMSILSIRLGDAQQDSFLHALAVGLLAGFAALLLHGLLDITVWGTRVSFLPWLLISLVTSLHLFLKSDLAL